MEPTRINTWENQKEDLQDYAAKWEKAVKDGVFADSSTVEKTTKEDTFFDIIKKEPTNDFNPADVEYWKDIQDMSFNTTEFKTYTEAKEPKTKENKSKKL